MWCLFLWLKFFNLYIGLHMIKDMFVWNTKSDNTSPKIEIKRNWSILKLFVKILNPCVTLPVKILFIGLSNWSVFIFCQKYATSHTNRMCSQKNYLLSVIYIVKWSHVRLHTALLLLFHSELKMITIWSINYCY